MTHKSTLLLLFCLGLFLNLNAQSTITLDSTTLTEREVAIGIQVPWEILWGPDDHIWATERRGQVLRINPENGNFITVLDLRSKVESGGEPGMLGMTLHPDFENTPLVYIAYNYLVGFSIRERLVSFEWNGANLVNEVTILDAIPGGGIHNGARLLISTDGKILMTTGDVGNSSLSQNMNSLSGKLLRINLDGSIPTDNPDPTSYVYSFGHRNSQGLAYGPNGQLYSSEHGAQQSDEFNIIEVDRNYGWPNVQGVCNTTAEINYCNNFNVKEPLAEWSPCVAVNGLEFYDHEAIPEWKGKMLMAVLGGFARLPRLSVLEFNDDGTEVVNEVEYFNNYGRIRDVCINPHNGAVYFATNGPSYPGSGPNRIIEYRNLDYNPITSVGGPAPADQFLKVFPNPTAAGAEMTLQVSPNFIGKQVELISFNGSIVWAKQIDGARLSIPTQQLIRGNYYIKATNEAGTITQKVVIQ
ncbi:MAG: PQQ-dependent sugar dehydrogenase [Bacteroidota bacterium]